MYDWKHSLARNRFASIPLILCCAIGFGVIAGCNSRDKTPTAKSADTPAESSAERGSGSALPDWNYQPRKAFDTSGFFMVGGSVKAWPPETPLKEVANLWGQPGMKLFAMLDQMLAQPGMSPFDRTR
ncbi:MAG: hypothetical protein JSS02_12120, partial [Planctomycetes bacterium]|nr:hypothetical protein [Planctomycetota bacterium]